MTEHKPAEINQDALRAAREDGDYAYQLGFDDGMAGFEDHHCPFAPDTIEWEHWLDGWDAAQEENE